MLLEPWWSCIVEIHVPLLFNTYFSISSYILSMNDNKFRKYVAYETTILEDKFKCVSTLKSH